MNENNNIIGQYKNGNYTTTLYADGSRDRVSEGDAFIPSFPESVELKITEKYDGEFPWFSSIKSENPKDAKLMETELNPLPFIKSIRPMTEVVIEGGYLDHPEIINLLCYFKRRNIPVKIIIGQDYFYGHDHLKYHRLLGWQNRGLMSRLGVILTDSEDQDFINHLQEFKDPTVIVTVGVFNGDDLDNLEGKGFNLLIKGYASTENNKEYTEANSQNIEYNREWLVRSIDSEFLPAFKSVSFDNLAISQLGLADERFTKKDEEHNNFYFAVDGDFSLYIDMINGEFSSSNYSKERYKIEEYMKTADKMFREIRKRRKI